MSAFSGNSDIVVAASLTLERESWKQDLVGAKGDLERFASEAKDISLKVPVVFDYAQVRTALDKLQADVMTMGGIKVPVTFVQSGGGDWRSVFAEASAGAGVGAVGGGGTLQAGYRDFLAARIAKGGRGLPGSVEPYGVAGDTYDVAPMEGPWGNQPMAAVTTAELEAEEFGDPWNSYGGGMRGAAARRGAAAGTGGGGGMRGMRLFMAAHIAIRGVEAAYGSYEYAHRDLGLMPDAGNLDAYKAERNAIDKYRAGLFGLTGKGRDLVHHLLFNTNRQSLQSFSSRFDDTENPHDLRHAMQMEVREKRAHALTEWNLREGEGNPEGPYVVREAQQRARIAQISAFGSHSAGQGAEIDAELAKQIDLANKRKEEMRKLHASEKDITQEYGALVQAARDQADAKRMLVMKTDARFQDETGVLELTNRDDYAGARTRNRAIRDRGILDAMGDTPDARHRIEELAKSDARDDFLRSNAVSGQLFGATSRGNALEATLRGDTLGAAQSRIAAEWVNSRTAIEGMQGRTRQEKDALAVQADRASSLDLQEAQKQDALKWARLTDEVHEIGIVSPYGREIATLQNSMTRAMQADPTHADLIRQRYQAQIDMTNLRHDVGVTGIRNAGVAASWMRDDHSHFHMVYKAGHRPQQVRDGPDPEYSRIRQEGDAMDREIAANAGDPETQRALIENYRDQLRDELDHTSGSRGRNAISSYLQHLSVADQKARSDARNNVAKPAGAGDDLKAIAAALAPLKNLKELYAVK